LTNSTATAAASRPTSVVGAGDRLPRHTSLRLRVLGCTLLLAVLGALVAGVGVTKAWQSQRLAHSLASVSHTLATLGRATIELSLERSLSQVVLALPQPITPDLRRLVDGQRAKSDAGLDAALTEARALNTSDRIDDFVGQQRQLRAKISLLRAEVDRIAARPGAERPADRVEAIPREIKEAVFALQATRLMLRGGGLPLPTDVALMESVRDGAWRLREFGGRERTYWVIAAALRTPISQMQLGEIETLRGRVVDDYRELSHTLEHAGLPAALVAATADVKRIYFGSYQTLIQGMKAQANLPQPNYPADFQSFFEQSTAALQTFITLSAAASDGIESFWAAEAGAQTRSLMVHATTLVAFLVVAALTARLVISVFGRLERLRGAMARLADGDLTTPIPTETRQDEVAAMARTLVVFRKAAEARREMEVTAAAERQAKDRRQAAMDRHTQEFGNSVSGVLTRLGESAETMRRSAESMTESATRARSQASNTAGGAAQSAGDLVAVASATEELSASVGEISRQVADAAKATRQAVELSTTTDQRVRSLTEAAGRIGTVAGLISDIAGRTNLLALNATIEAARAGEAGKGFAVVASEVKQLAAQTAHATGEIGEQITAIQGATEEAATAMRDVGDTIRRLDQIAASIAEAVQQQGSATREIAASVNSVSAATEAAVRAMEDVSGVAELVQGASGEVLDTAVAVRTQAETLRTDVDEFLTAMRAPDEDRRRYERLPAKGLGAELMVPDHTPYRVTIEDISRGGIGILSDLDLPPGIDAAVRLDGTTTACPARVAQSGAGRLAFAFRQDPVTLGTLDVVIARLRAEESARAA